MGCEEWDQGRAYQWLVFPEEGCTVASGQAHKEAQRDWSELEAELPLLAGYLQR